MIFLLFILPKNRILLAPRNIILFYGSLFLFTITGNVGFDPISMMTNRDISVF